ncbi:hypothetical protein AKJ09_04314 [Labilithrix luteola]|uniref:Uncharacterized protein n=1 Tax=Labilithrix luteola TaxID=1391654 RepID=A0A0K1PVU0_9BACT|nr:hypothetical protein [Labilithrix luteola]AKU97650.1 hypothetical protein AKJ09_04314 [Labilithrix luteola]
MGKQPSKVNEATAARPPAAPPPRPLGRPLTVRPAWEDALLDLRDGPIPPVVIASLVGFVVARFVTSGFVPWVLAVVAGGIGFGVHRYRHPPQP